MVGKRLRFETNQMIFISILKLTILRADLDIVKKKDQYCKRIFFFWLFDSL